MNYIRLMSRASDLIIMAERKINEVRSDKDVDTDLARIFYAHAWGLYRLGGNYEGMVFCRRKLESTGLQWDDLVKFQQGGFAAAIGDILREEDN